MKIIKGRGALGSKHSYVLGKLSYFDGNYPFIDRIKSGVGFNGGSGSRTFNSKGWLTALGAGAHAQMLVVISAAWFPPGDYKLVSTSAGTLSVNASTGITNNIPGVGTCTFTVTDLGDADTWTSSFSLYVNVVNSTGSPIAVTDLKCYKVAHETLLNAGEIFDPDYLAGLQGAGVLRGLEWFGQNTPGGGKADGIWKFSDYGLQDEDKTSYLPGGAPDAGGMPVSIFMKLCKKVGARPWLNMGNASLVSFVEYTASDNRIRVKDWDYSVVGNNRFANGVGVQLLSGTNPAGFTPPFNPTTTTYYVINSIPGVGGSFQLSTTVGGAAVTIGAADINVAGMGYAEMAQVDNYDEYNNMYLPFAQAAYAADPDARPLVEFSNEVWNSLYGIYPFNVRITSGLRLGSLSAATGYLFQAMKAFKAFESTYPVAQVGRVVAWFTGALDSGYLDMVGTGYGLNYLDVANTYDSTKTYGQILLQAPTRCYYAVATYINADDGAGHAGPGSYTAASAYAANGNSTTYSDAFWDSQFAASIIYNTTHPIAGMTAIRASLDTYLPGVNLCMYEWGQQVFYGIAADAKWKTTAESLSAYLASAAGAAMYERAWAANIVPFNLAFVNHYNSEGSWVLATTGFSRWGIRNRNTDNATSIWFRTK